MTEYGSLQTILPMKYVNTILDLFWHVTFHLSRQVAKYSSQNELGHNTANSDVVNYSDFTGILNILPPINLFKHNFKF